MGEQLDEDLLEEDLVRFAIKQYYTPQGIDFDEFYTDLKRFQYVKRLLNRYCDYGKLGERLVLNHLVILYNIFGDATTDMLFYKLGPEYWSDLKTYLVYIHRMPLETVVSPGIKETDIPLNNELIAILRKL